MFGFKKKVQHTPSQQRVRLTVSGMHCPSCGMNIDGELEETPGVVSATTSYATGFTTIIFDDKLTNVATLQKCISSLGYTAVVAD